ncbi:MAG: bifunctional 3,4-dihydroxy-2-butanone-4-phosphate synthase/GTP cyclohydrolase II [Candidatus Sericytochromatia bacterium]|nr:bifunctional 3,4-dihydroxy-2-butanone-4-phosphate synthase/GTP cyclohydrolase II [Candidatus Sericytochromatia bacterium]
MENRPVEFAPIESVLEALRHGQLVLVVDDEDRENEGDLIAAAAVTTPETINFMVTHGRGLVCLAVTPQTAEHLALVPMSSQNTDPHGTAFTVSVDASEGTTTGISAADRARTVAVVVNPESRPADLRRPGHIFPLVARAGGVLERAGHTEAAVDLARLAGLAPAGVICEVLNPDGTMARLPQLLEMARERGLLLTSIARLIEYRLQKERFIKRVAHAQLPNVWGDFQIYGYVNSLDGSEHVALVLGDPSLPGTLVRMHSECLTGDALGSRRCDCGEQRDAALEAIRAEGRGVFVYLKQEGRGIGLLNKLKAYALQDQGLDTVEANQRLGFAPDLRQYGVGAQILVDLGISSMRLLTNNPRKVVGLEGYGLTVEGRVPLMIQANPHNQGYLGTKARKLGHLL